MLDFVLLSVLQLVKLICVSWSILLSLYLKKRGHKFYFQKRIPKEFEHLFAQKSLQISLKTECRAKAMQRSQNLNALLNEFWDSITPNYSNDYIKGHYKQIIETARQYRFMYLPQEQLLRNGSLIDIANRLEVAHAHPAPYVKEAVLGGILKPQITVKEALKEFLDFEKGNLQGYSDNQIRKWENPRKRAVTNFIQAIGLKNVEVIKRQDILKFRQWWIDRIQEHDLSANSANKDFGFIKQILNHVNNSYQFSMSVHDLFIGIRLKEKEKTPRYPLPNDFISEKLLGQALDGLNDEARLFIYAMIETGARISELVGLDDQNGDVVLDHPVPHIKIRPNEIRTLKTPQSERDIPLVGVSLYAFQQLNGGFDRYLGRRDLLSNTINKYFRTNNILPSENHSLYSLRHSFEDRLTAVEPPEKVQAILMGHKYVRERYGHGPSLEQKQSWLEKIAFPIKDIIRRQ